MAISIIGLVAGSSIYAILDSNRFAAIALDGSLDGVVRLDPRPECRSMRRKVGVSFSISGRRNGRARFLYPTIVRDYCRSIVLTELFLREQRAALRRVGDLYRFDDWRSG